MILMVNENIRLRCIPIEEYDKAIPWYQDEEIQYLVNGIKEPYEYDMICRMFNYLKAHGELYFIEVKEDNDWVSIGDVSLVKETDDDLPITIGDKNYWNKGIGTIVIKFLIERAKMQGRKILKVNCYDFNTGSIKLFASLGFKQSEERKGLGYIYYLTL